MTLRGEWPCYATAIGAFSCVLISLAFIVPWYGADYDYWSGTDNDYRVEYSVGMKVMGDTMPIVAIVLMLSLAASIIATVLAYYHKRAIGVIAGLLSAGFLLASGIVFYNGITDELRLDGFAGHTELNRSWVVETAPMLGWWIAILGPIVPMAHAIVLANLDRDDSRKSP